MAYPILRFKSRKKLRFFSKLEYRGIWGRLSQSGYQAFEIKNSGQNFAGGLDFAQNSYTGVLEIAVQGFVIGPSKFKMAEPVLLLKLRRKLRFDRKLIYRGFEVADQDFRLSKFKIADTIWQ